MVVHRVTQWLKALLSPRTSRSRVTADARVPLLVGAGATFPPTTAIPTETPRALNWLAASRRLRPARTISIGTMPSAGGKAVAKGETGREQVAATCPRPQPPAEDATKRGDAAEKPQGQTQQTDAKSQPLRRETPAAKPQPPSPAAPSEQGDYAARRRLMALKHLVRMGVYNEGFQQGAAPDQYRQSLGLDDELGNDLGAIE